MFIVKNISTLINNRDSESDLADHGVRKYDYITGRFMVVDPLWDKYSQINPYHHAANNPILLLDRNWENFVEIEDTPVAPDGGVNGDPNAKTKDKKAKDAVKSGNERIIGHVYTGPWNPDGYSQTRKDESDKVSMVHDQNYDANGAVGATGLLLDAREGVYGADQEFVKNQMNAVNGYIEGRDAEVTKSPVTFLTSAKATFVGTLIGIATAIKTLPYSFQSAVSKLKSEITPSF